LTSNQRCRGIAWLERLATAGRSNLPEAADIFFVTPFSNQFETNETQLSYFPKY